MSFPSTPTITTNLSSGTGDPSLARLELLQTATAVNDMISSQNSALGVALLNGDGRYDATKFPAQITLPAVYGTQVINPQSGYVNLRNYIRLQPLFLLDVQNNTTMQAGDMAFITNYGTGADEKVLAFYTGTKWVKLPLAGMADL